MTQRWLNCFVLSSSWNHSFSDGNSPFYFDSKGSEGQTIHEKATVYYDSESKWSASVESGYNWTTQKYEDIIYQSLINPISEARWTNRFRFNNDTHRFVDLIGDLALSYLGTNTWTLSYAKDLTTGQLTRGQSSLAMVLNPENSDENIWTVKLTHEYDPNQRNFLLRTWEVQKALHCRKLTVSWNEVRKEWKFFYEINAFPDQPFGVSNAQATGLKLEGFLGKALKLE